MLRTVVVDYAGVSNSDWNFFQEDAFQSSSDIYNAMAAIMAVCAGLMLFVSLIRTDSHRWNDRVNLGVRIVGFIAVLLSGAFWLLSASNGDPTPYILAMVPIVALLLYGLAMGLVLMRAYQHDEQMVRKTGRAKFNPKLSGIGTLLILLAGIALVAILSAPGWIR